MVFLYQHEITSQLNVNQHRCVNNFKLSFETLYGWQTASVASASQKLRLPCRFYSQILHSFVRLSYCDSCEHASRIRPRLHTSSFTAPSAPSTGTGTVALYRPLNSIDRFTRPLLCSRIDQPQFQTVTCKNSNFARTDDQQEYISNITFGESKVRNRKKGIRTPLA